MTSRRASAAGSTGWRIFFTVAYRLLRLIDPVIRWAWRARLPGLDRAVDLETIGGRTGRRRRTLLTELTIDGRRYVGHPNGRAAWTRNLETSNAYELRRPDGRIEAGRAQPVHAEEREQVIRATWSQQPFPANVAYWLARDHIRAIAIYFRLEPAPASESEGESGPR